MNENVVHLDKPMTRAQLIRHLSRAHTHTGVALLLTKPAGLEDTRDLTDQELVDAHRLIHLGLER